jgi:phage terminase large subunit
MARDRRWTFTAHHGPHDMDAHEIFTGTTRKRAAKSLGYHFEVTAMHAVADGIDATRRLFPRMYFDAEGCGKSEKPKPNGLDILRSYRGEYDPVRRRLANVPVHDWASHGADALRCYVMGRKQAERSDWQRPLHIARG